MARRSEAIRRVGLVWTVALALLASEAKAEGEADAAKAIIHEHCVGCHEVPGYERERNTPALEAPSFPEMAADPGTYTAERLRRFLQQPHWPMGQFQLSPRDIDNLLAFIQSVDAN
jgi:mono/diheme cytochrome c family protein